VDYFINLYLTTGNKSEIALAPWACGEKTLETSGNTGKMYLAE